MQTSAMFTSTSATQQKINDNAARWQKQVKERRAQEEQERERRTEERRCRKQRYAHETLERKVERLVSKGLEYDAIRGIVEEDLPLLRPTPARLRQRREWIARLVNDYRQRGGRHHRPPMTPEEIKALYRTAAARFHPDRAADDADRCYRHGIMTLVNQAYRARDGAQIQAILHDEDFRPETAATAAGWEDRQAA